MGPTRETKEIGDRQREEEGGERERERVPVPLQGIGLCNCSAWLAKSEIHRAGLQEGPGATTAGAATAVHKQNFFCLRKTLVAFQIIGLGPPRLSRMIFFT